VKTISLIALTLCGLVIRCSPHEDTAAAEKGRSIQPMLTGSGLWGKCQPVLRSGHLVEEARCGDAPLPETRLPWRKHCDAVISTREDATRLVVDQSTCLDTAIAALKGLSANDPKAASDLAAAYYLRAQREDQAADLLDAFDAVSLALKAGPLPQALFNRALIDESLGFSADAAESWKRYIESHPLPAWEREARDHLTGLTNQLNRPPSLEWGRAEDELPAALDANDVVRVRRLIGPYTWSARHYLEETLLKQWAENPSPHALVRAERLANELSRHSGDSYATDLVSAVARVQGSGEKLEALRRGQIAYSEARDSYRALDFDHAVSRFKESERLLARGGSPLAVTAMISRAGISAKQNEALQLLTRADRLAKVGHWRQLLAQSLHTRATVLLGLKRSAEALEAQDRARADFEDLRDTESVAMAEVNRADTLIVLGQHEMSWEAVVRALHSAPAIADVSARHKLLGNAALAAQSLGHPLAALRYQSHAVEDIQESLRGISPENLSQLERLHRHLTIALRGRADFEVETGAIAAAERDLAEASRLITAKADKGTRSSLDASIHEVAGHAAMQERDPLRAIAAFTTAISLTDSGFGSFRASLLAERAKAYLLARRRAEAEADLRTALSELRIEQTNILAHRQPGSHEEIWSSYFLRFQDTYRSLIQQLIDDEQPVDAFRYAEEARGFEPLHLALQRKNIAASLGDVATLGLNGVCAALAPDTFLLEYCVLEDRTYVWLLSHAGPRLFTYPVSAAKIVRWSSELQEAARNHDDVKFESGLVPPYEQLIAKPLAEVEKMNGAGVPFRLVIVPDGPMQGLPFVALRESKKPQRYLIERAPVAIQASAALYVASLRRDRELSKRQERSVLIVADPAFRENTTLAQRLSRLSGAAGEATILEALYSPFAEVLQDREATTAAFLLRARDKSIVHFAGHGIANPRAPYRSLLLLAPGENDTGELEAATLLKDLQLDRTRLVVLSACSSAGGLAIGPEGLAPLVRPLIGAGVPAVIGTLWDVDDATASALLVSFHQSYRQGNDAAIALQRAQVEMLRKTNQEAQPARAWAPFQLIGYTSSPFKSPP
jgi:CHAT domain-containing protein